jgi:pimeloyl-ACP methyl ester carboxylesterase
VERGEIGTFPCLVGGEGEPLVLLAGLSPDVGVHHPATRRIAAGLIAPLASARRVHYVNRRRGLPRGITIAALAAEHADAIRASFGGPVDAIGVSTGGSIAQQLAADHPDAVRRLVLVGAACRLGPAARSIQRAIAARIRAGARRQAFALMGADLVSPGRRQVPLGALAWALGPLVFSDPSELDDMATTIEAEDAFDLAACREAIRAPTLIVAGERDRFYTPELFAETAELIPDGRLRPFAGRGHVTVLADPRYAPEVVGFLDAEALG